MDRAIHFLILVLKIYYHVDMWWELRKLSTKGFYLDVTTNSQHLYQKNVEGRVWRISQWSCVGLGMETSTSSHFHVNNLSQCIEYFRPLVLRKLITVKTCQQDYKVLKNTWWRDACNTTPLSLMDFLSTWLRSKIRYIPCGKYFFRLQLRWDTIQFGWH